MPLVDHDVQYRYDEVLDWIIDSVRPLGEDYREQGARGVRRALDRRLRESGQAQRRVFGAGVRRRIPYMLLNYNDTLDAVFTLAHEMGHSIHTLLSHETQPFVYAGYTIFVAEVPSTLSEALLLDLMLERAKTREERIVLLQHAIDGIVGTFYNQVLFADFELQAHTLVEQRPADHERRSSATSTRRLLDEYWGDALSPDDAREADLGAHSALLPVAVLRLSVRDVLCVDREADERRAAAPTSAVREQAVEALSRSAARRRQRLPDESARARGRRSQRAEHGARGRQAAR